MALDLTLPTIAQVKTSAGLGSVADTWLDVDELERPKSLSLFLSL